MSAVAHPPIPKALDDALFLAMIDAVGESLAFRAVDAAWKAFCSKGVLLTKSDTRRGTRDVLELEVSR